MYSVIDETGKERLFQDKQAAKVYARVIGQSCVYELVKDPIYESSTYHMVMI